ncbi:hypothetical protein M0R45_014408 [Rubus argutus]|uniref:Uncharacterized protein n=1 Tax=Rubus argutus TaxID=59490 RepID=A0AAW1XMV1_RUBAR
MLIFPELFLSFSSLSVLIVMEERVSTEVAVPQMISVSKRPLTIMLDTILEEEYYDLELIKPCCRQFSDQLLVMILTYHVMRGSRGDGQGEEEERCCGFDVCGLEDCSGGFWPGIERRAAEQRHLNNKPRSPQAGHAHQPPLCTAHKIGAAGQLTITADFNHRRSTTSHNPIQFEPVLSSALHHLRA